MRCRRWGAGPQTGHCTRTAVPEQTWLLPNGTEVLVAAKLHRASLDQPVDAGQHLPRVGVLGVPDAGAQEAPQVSHRGGGGDVVPDDVTHDDAHRAVRQLQQVVEVAADGGRRRGADVVGGRLDAAHLRQDRQQ